MKNNGTRSPDAIIADIQQIRSEMDSTLLAIEERLTPGQVIDQGLDYLRNSGGREYLTNLGNSVKTNPLPATLAGIGLAWLMVTGQRDSRPGRTGRVEYDRAGIRTAPGVPLHADEDSPTLRERAGDVRETVVDVTDGVAGAAASARDRVSDAMGDARDRVSDAVYSTRERVADTAQRARDMASGTAQRARDAYARTADTAREQMERARSGYRQVVQEQPLVLGAVGIGIGALLAALAPRTRQEDALMGTTADAMKRRAVETGHEQLNRAGDVMRSATQADRTPGKTGDLQTELSEPAHVAPGSSPSSVPTPTGANMARPTSEPAAGGRLDE